MSHEPPAGQQPNPYGPPPGSPPPPGTSPYSQPPFPPQGAPTAGPWQPGPPPTGPHGGGPGADPGRPRRRGGLIALLVVLLLLAGGGTAIAFATRGGDDEKKKDADTSAPSGQPSGSPTGEPSEASTEGAPTEGTSPSGPATESAGPDGPQAPGEGPDTSLWRGSPRASEFQDDWEFRWEEHTYKARAVVARDHADCAEIAADDRLTGLDCTRAVTATYVNERDQVTFTNYYVKFDDRANARKVAAMKDADTLVTIDGDAVWDDWTQGSWRTTQVKRIVVLTVATAPKSAKAQTVQDYLSWAHKDFALALRFSKSF
ncbi:hypothetical protein [Nocardioides daejeonensis]|uniref:hypothetical protein n=1 Tax=Nocardioides daejeonensis TaxID=1046556 RepID=UPI0013A53D8C|nr:hypothetical protein [Nocardioides daejeonensis]